MIETSKSKALLRLLVYLFASNRPCSLKILLYKGMKPVAIPAPMKEKTTYGIVCDMR